jgi:hypothetical protein
VVQEAGARNRRRNGEGDGHVQAVAPVERLSQRAAEQQADGTTHAGDRGVDAEGLAALGGLGECRCQQRERGRREHRREDALQRACRHERLEALRGTTGGGRAREAEQAGDERPLAAEQIGDPAAEQQQTAEGQRVGGDHPLAVVVGEAQVSLGGRQRDVHDGHVEHDHQLSDADDGEDEPATIVMGTVGSHGRSPCHI